jgi:UDP-N-acetylmuramate--alanine ligase
MTEFETGKAIHFIGIAGSGMSGIARILLARGFSVSGSDEKESATLTNLALLGAKTFIGHKSDQIKGADYLVISSAIPESNPELVAARESGIPVLRRAQALARLLPGRFSIAVAGTHGKTTTSGIFAQALTSMGRDPSFVIGSKVRNLGESAAEGKGPEFIIEADESDGSFLEYRPDGAIITNIELDHVDNFTHVEDLVALFNDFATTVKRFIILCQDDPLASKISVPATLRRISYGTSTGSDLLISHFEERSEGSRFTLSYKDKDLGVVQLKVPGFHNALNATAVIAATIAMDLEMESVISGVSHFSGTERRFEIKGMAHGITVVDDYGHHPTEISATIAAARSHLAHSAMREDGTGRLVIIFQPHRYSRTAAFIEDFAEALQRADKCFLLDIYSAGEKIIAGISSEAISRRIEGSEYVSSFEEAVERVTEWARPGDLILTLGAGDVTSLGPRIIKALESH